MAASSARDVTVETGLELLCLGTGTSHGVPMIGCDCAVCQSDDSRNKRTRCSVLVSTAGRNILIDTSTDLRTQALTHQVTRVDAVLYTHSHADHLHGIDDLRSFTLHQRTEIPCYGDADTMALIRERYPYIFRHQGASPTWSIPRISLTTVDGPFAIGETEIIPVPLEHGKQTIFGYRIGSLAYLTDCSRIPDRSYPLLQDLHTLIIDGLRQRPHRTHFSIEQAVQAVQHLAPAQAFLTHLTHDVDHATVEADLPEPVRLAYDGLRLQIPDPAQHAASPDNG